MERRERRTRNGGIVYKLNENEIKCREGAWHERSNELKKD